METHGHDKPSLRKLDSTVVLERMDSAASSVAYLRQETGPLTSPQTDAECDNPNYVESGGSMARLAPIGLDVSIRFGRLGLLMVLAVSVLTAFTIAFNRGIVLGHFDPTTTTADAQKRLIDDYNSYTGNVASAFGRPIEIFVALAVHVVLLRVMKAAFLRTEISWKTDLFTLAVTAAVGFLITNGLNALNVQSQPPDITPIISAVDLTFAPDVSMSDAASRSTNLTQSFSERSPKNPITNTVLRNLVLARVPAKIPHCVKGTDTYVLPDLVLEFGFPQRDWQSRLMQEALEPKQLRVIVNPSNKTDNQLVDVNDLPMNASVAAELFLHSVLLAPYYFPCSHSPNFANETDLKNRYPTNDTSDSAAQIFNLKPPATLALNETMQREWFLRESAAAWTRKLNNTALTVRSDIVMEFSRVDISPTMRFAALSIEVETDLMHFTQTIPDDNATRYNNVKMSLQCGPSSMMCLMQNPGIPGPAVSLADSGFDPHAHVHVFGICVNPHGTDELFLEGLRYDLSDFRYGHTCAGTSNTSLMVMSIGKRFVAQSMRQNITANESGYFDDADDSSAISNLRRIHTFTIAKLSWDPQNLTAEFNARCATDTGSCEGLRSPLIPTTATESLDQELIVGVDALPMSLLAPLVNRGEVDSRFLPLVQLHQPPSKSSGEEIYNTLAADPLLPHNVGSITWDTQQPLTQRCNVRIEDRLQLIFNNHMYIEHGLQTAYTAATFFLLQNGVVKDVIKLNDNKTSLNFQKSTQRVALLASIPMQNAWLTLGGCALLVVGLCSVLVWAWAASDDTSAKSDPCRGLGHVTTPHVVARVMLDSVHFPPLFLHRRVTNATGTDDSGDDKAAPSVEGFVIDGLALQRPPQEEKQETSCARSA